MWKDPLRAALRAATSPTRGEVGARGKCPHVLRAHESLRVWPTAAPHTPASPLVGEVARRSEAKAGGRGFRCCSQGAVLPVRIARGWRSETSPAPGRLKRLANALLAAAVARIEPPANSPKNRETGTGANLQPARVLRVLKLDSQPSQ